MHPHSFYDRMAKEVNTMNEFENYMQSILKDDYPAFQNALQQPDYKAIHINTQKDPHLTIPQKFSLKAHPYVRTGYYFDKEMLPLGRYAYHDAGLYYIQEPSAMLVAELADLKPGMKVLDLCAAPGGKATRAALLVGKQGLLVANDINANRARILSENIERFGLENTIVLCSDPQALVSRFENYFDAIILDAPCSGEGMFRKLDQAVETWSPQKVDECAHIQSRLIEQAYHMLKPGGTLMYSTCTYEIKENEDQVRQALDRFALKLVPLEVRPGMAEGIELAGTLRLYPHLFHGEGHFIAKMIKEENGSTTSSHFNPQSSNLNREQQQLISEFYANNLKIPLPRTIIANQNHLYAIRTDFPDLKGLRVLRQGLYLGECKKKRFEPSHSLALSLSKDDVQSFYDYPYDSIEIKKYMHGETLEGHHENGFALILVDGFSLGFAKEVNHVLKNYYPKGLRK